MNFTEYLRASNAHLNSTLKNLDGSTSKYYTKVNNTCIEEARMKLLNVLTEALDNKMISKEEFDAMNPEGKGAAKFYLTFKVHKEHKPGSAPPERPICSGSGSMYENVSTFVEHFIKEAGTTHQTYLKDTPDFFRFIEEINKTGNISEKSMLLTMDVIGLFTNIPKEDGINAVTEALEEKEVKEINTQFLVRLLRLILENNIMEFNSELYKQEIGAPMGSKPVPPYANTFVARKIDHNILKIAEKYSKDGKLPMEYLKRFLDDLFSIWNGTSKELHQFHK